MIGYAPAQSSVSIPEAAAPAVTKRDAVIEEDTPAPAPEPVKKSSKKDSKKKSSKKKAGCC